MTTTSYPAVGANGLSETQWSVLFGDSDGIVEDYHDNGVEAFHPTVSGDVLTIGVGKVRVNGYVLSVDSPESFTLAPSASIISWSIAAVYDPALNVAQPDGSADPVGPVRLLATQGAPSLSGGKVAIALFRFNRNPGQALSAALSAALLPTNGGGDVRSWRGPQVFISDYVTSLTGFGPWPRGTRLIQANPNGTGWIQESIRLPTADGSALTFVSKDFAPALPLPVPGGLVSRDPAPSAPQYLRMPGNHIKLRGNLKRSTGAALSTGNDVILATMPAGCRPPFTERFICKAGTGDHFAEVRVNTDGTTDGRVIMSDPGFTCTWIDLSAIHYRAEV